MRALILNCFEAPTTLSENMSAWVASELAAHRFEVDLLATGTMQIMSCRACFDCWLKTPGKCCYNDDFETVARAYLHSELVLVWTPVVFGTYAGGMKKVLERMIGLMTPFFRFDGGETHHPPRYDHNPAFFGLGWLTAPEPAWAEIFRRLVARNAANLMSPRHAAATLRDETGRAKVCATLRAFLKALREGQ
jgi:hypothetical protein